MGTPQARPPNRTIMMTIRATERGWSIETRKISAHRLTTPFSCLTRTGMDTLTSPRTMPLSNLPTTPLSLPMIRLSVETPLERTGGPHGHPNTTRMTKNLGSGLATVIPQPIRPLAEFWADRLGRQCGTGQGNHPENLGLAPGVQTTRPRIFHLQAFEVLAGIVRHTLETLPQQAMVLLDATIRQDLKRRIYLMANWIFPRPRRFEHQPSLCFLSRM